MTSPLNAPQPGKDEPLDPFRGRLLAFLPREGCSFRAADSLNNERGSPRLQLGFEGHGDTSKENCTECNLILAMDCTRCSLSPMKTTTIKNEFTNRSASIVESYGKVQLFVTAPHIDGKSEIAINNTERVAAIREAARKAKNWIGE